LIVFPKLAKRGSRSLLRSWMRRRKEIYLWYLASPGPLSHALSLSMRVQNQVVAGLLALGVALAFVSPVLISKGTPRLTDSQSSLPRQAAIRGAYSNSGSRDAGPDTTAAKKKQAVAN